MAPRETGGILWAVRSYVVAVDEETPVASAGSLFLYSEGGLDPFC